MSSALKFIGSRRRGNLLKTPVEAEKIKLLKFTEKEKLYPQVSTVLHLTFLCNILFTFLRVAMDGVGWLDELAQKPETCYWVIAQVMFGDSNSS